MNCPICGKKLTNMVCDCGYDASLDYERYPTLSPVPSGLESVTGARERKNQLLCCSGCGHCGFTVRRDNGELKCIRCGQVVTKNERKSVEDRMFSEQRDLEELLRRKAHMEYELDDLAYRVHQERKKLRELNAALDAEMFGHSREETGWCRRIKAVAAGYYVTVAVYADGTASAVGTPYYGRCDVKKWNKVIAAAVCDMHTFGLTEDGTVLCTGKGEIPRIVSRWKDIIAISANKTGIFGLTKDGKVLTACGGVEKHLIKTWRGIKEISAGDGYIVGRRRDGTVVAAGRNDKGQCEVSDWRNIKSISAGTDCTIGLKEDGSAINTGYKQRVYGKHISIHQNNYPDENLKDSSVVYGIREDNTVNGILFYLSCKKKFRKWRDVIDLVVIKGNVIGLKKDGTLVYVKADHELDRDISALNRVTV